MEIVEILRNKKLNSGVFFFFFKQQHIHHVICIKTRVIPEQIVLNVPASAKVALHVANRTLLKLRQIDHLYVKLCIRSG